MRAPRHTNFAVTRPSKATDTPEARALRLVKAAAGDLRAVKAGMGRPEALELLQAALWNLNKAVAGLKGAAL
jgi:hypothetical protein